MRNYLASFGLLTAEELDVLETKVVCRKLQKGDFFIQSGQTSREVGFVVSGVLRSYYYSSAEEEVTYCFTFSNSFVSAYSSFLSQQPTVETIQTLTDVELLCIFKSDMLALEGMSTNWLKLFKLIAEQEYIKLEKRIFLLQKETAEKRYLDLLAHQPEYLQMIPLNYLASYLGITQRHLSRIRKQLSK